MVHTGCLPVGISLTTYSEEGAKTRFRSLCQTAPLKPKRLLFELTHAFAGANRVLVLGRAHRLEQTGPLFQAAHIGWSKTDSCFGSRRPAGTKQTPCLGRADPLEQTDPLFGPRRPAGANRPPVWAAQTRWSKTDPLFGPRTSAGANRPPGWAAHIGWSKQTPCLGCIKPESA